MNGPGKWTVTAAVAMILATLIAVLGIWGVIDGFVAIKLYFTMFVIGLAVAYIRSLVAVPLSRDHT